MVATLAAAISALALGAGDRPPLAGALPAVHVRVTRQIRDEPKVPGHLRMTGYDGRIGIETRGQWTRRYPKKSYSIELRDAEGDNLNVPLLGMPADDDWILYAAYNDRTLMRNVLAYDASRWIGRYAARTRFVELWMNGGYRGVYVLMEKLKVHPRRIRVGDDGFLLERTTPLQARRKDPSFLSPVLRTPLVWADPERPDLSRTAARRIRRAAANAERALYRGSSNAWRRHLHARAAVDHALLNELFKNADGFRASAFMHGRPGRALTLGPIWDFDLSMGKATSAAHRSSAGWILADRPWAQRLYADRGFARAMARRWRSLRRGGLVGRLLRHVDRTSRRLEHAARRDASRWPARGERLGGRRELHVGKLERWLRARARWMDRNMPVRPR